MPEIGQTLSHYRILEKIGVGGMGEVYRAKDQKLGRDVAIKVLPEEFAKDADRVARFQREAKLLASLNHPNIASIYGLEESEGTQFLVLELIEGDTLADRLNRGAIPVEESLKLALQIAEALEADHEKGVIHRDLKPANIKVTHDGKVKVLDFGLAKAFAGDSEDMNLSNSPTLSAAATQQGVILGTAAYMSPEQARGNPVDKRADIWAFGVVLFEMLTGRPIFSEDTVSDTLASVLKTEPEWQSLPQNLHPRIRFLLERCLKKDSRNRCSGISDARVDIQEVLADPGGLFVLPVASEEPRTRVRMILPWAAAALVLGGIIVGMLIWKLKPAPPLEPRQVMRSEYVLPEEQQFALNISPLLSVSPDGSQFVYSTIEGIYLRSLDELDARLISGSDDRPLCPFFSPDGQWIAYWAGRDDQLKKIAISSGVPVTLCSAPDLKSAEWSVDDTIVYSGAEGIMRVSAKGGTPEPIVEGEANQFFAPQILPDGKSVLFTIIDGGETMIAVQSIESGEHKELVAGTNAKYLPTGHLAYIVENDLYAASFDPGTL